MKYVNLFIIVLITILQINISTGLECYVCDNQEDNVEKCLNTIKTCEHGDDVCETEIKWGSTPYWSQGSIKQFYISKGCSTKDKCERMRSSNMPLCTHIWYEDWKCSECCKGDRCNYFIISGSTKIHIGALTILSVLTTLIINNLIN